MLAPYVFIKNNQNTIQITDAYRNLCLISRQTRVCELLEWQGSRTATGIEVTTTAKIPMVAVRCLTHTIGLLSVVKSGNSTTYTFFATPNFGVFPTVEVYIFDEVPITYRTVNGMTIWKSDRTIAFDSDARYARVTDMLVSTDYGTLMGKHAYPSSKQYAVVFSGYAGERSTGVNESSQCPQGKLVQNIVTWVAARALSDGIFLENIGLSTVPRCMSSPPAEIEYKYSKAQILVLDVTGY